MLYQDSNKYISKASASLSELTAKDPNATTFVYELIESLSDNSILLPLILFSLPIGIPLPYPPGFTTVVGIPLLFLSYQMIIGSKTIKLPGILSKYKIKNSTLITICNKIIPIIKFIERYIKPRMRYPNSPYCQKISGILCFIASLSIAIPLPFTNAIPALGVAVISIGLINRDGIAIIIGILITIIGIIVAIFFLLVYYFGIKHLLNILW
ncbi:exopolysaccharide biosynthesis protein [Rickettsia endosymbiont of Cardiosporidium cionae]|uniref:exopolysaccharide biosynthesis protein n=1 Tax=Rickettsia endosymbiont of Cardiosporidium cionae TaxID=2777155 RepID=UPI0018939590|nr:exopolysaccharide biosynthesis protein [Rickettsia endosymbiont of Cardiosporidium cionae]KAF8818490.1 exopolysaccharide biosynthesis protein [Rickettsia endosymbiont of Cardiosporidium cionae]